MMDLVEQMRNIIERQTAKIEKLQKQVDSVAELVAACEEIANKECNLNRHHSCLGCTYTQHCERHIIRQALARLKAVK